MRGPMHGLFQRQGCSKSPPPDLGKQTKVKRHNHNQRSPPFAPALLPLTLRNLLHACHHLGPHRLEKPQGNVVRGLTFLPQSGIVLSDSNLQPLPLGSHVTIRRHWPMHWCRRVARRVDDRVANRAAVLRACSRARLRYRDRRVGLSLPQKFNAGENLTARAAGGGGGNEGAVLG